MNRRYGLADAVRLQRALLDYFESIQTNPCDPVAFDSSSLARTTRTALEGVLSRIDVRERERRKKQTFAEWQAEAAAEIARVQKDKG